MSLCLSDSESDIKLCCQNKDFFLPPKSFLIASSVVIYPTSTVLEYDTRSFNLGASKGEILCFSSIEIPFWGDHRHQAINPAITLFRWAEEVLPEGTTTQSQSLSWAESRLHTSNKFLSSLQYNLTMKAIFS